MFNGTGGNLFGVTDAMAARPGGGQLLAYPLQTAHTRISTVASHGDSVLLPNSVPQNEVLIINDANNILYVYPIFGEMHAGKAVNAPATLLPGIAGVWSCYNWGIWTQTAPRLSIIPITLTGSTLISDELNGATLVYFGSSAITLTFPASLSPNFNCSIVQMGTGQITCVGSGGASVVNAHSFTKTFGQYALIGIAWMATNTFMLSGDGA